MKIHSIVLILALLTLTTQTNLELHGKVVEVEPVALDIVASSFPKVIVLFYNSSQHLQMKQTKDSAEGQKSEDCQVIKNYKEAVEKILVKLDKDYIENILFAYVDLGKDKSNKIKDVSQVPTIRLSLGVVSFDFEVIENGKNNEIDIILQQKINKYLYEKPKIIQQQNLKNLEGFTNSFTLVFEPSNDTQLQRAKAIHKKIFDFLNIFSVNFAIITPSPTINNLKSYTKLYNNGQLYSKYPQSAVDAIFNESIELNQFDTNDLVDFLNVETLDDVVELSEKNSVRVFGSSIDHQMLLVFRQNDRENPKIKQVMEQFKVAANKNRNQGLKYERIFCAVGSAEFFQNEFVESLIQKDQLYNILITQTDYSQFQLRKFKYPHEEVTSEKLLQFIEDVKMKRIDAQYKSEPVPDNEGKKIRKIVGSNFESQVFGEGNKSVVVLFVDSKDDQSYEIKLALEQFVDKFHDAYKEHMNVGIFDLAKNQYKTLSIRNAPTLAVFERTDKKKPKVFKGAADKQIIKNWVNYYVRDVTIPENYGEPPIAIGGATFEL